jgi:hypothetical protein
MSRQARRIPPSDTNDVLHSHSPFAADIGGIRALSYLDMRLWEERDTCTWSAAHVWNNAWARLGVTRRRSTQHTADRGKNTDYGKVI